MAGGVRLGILEMLGADAVCREVMISLDDDRVVTLGQRGTLRAGDHLQDLRAFALGARRAGGRRRDAAAGR